MKTSSSTPSPKRSSRSSRGTDGLHFGIEYDRLNRRKIDLIPAPAWKDPPKRAIGELLSATEARLRGGGLAAMGSARPSS